MAGHRGCIALLALFDGEAEVPSGVEALMEPTRVPLLPAPLIGGHLWHASSRERDVNVDRGFLRRKQARELDGGSCRGLWVALKARPQGIRDGTLMLLTT